MTRELRTGVGAALVVLAVSVINPLVWNGQGIPLLVTPIGASAVLVFSNPQGAKAWPVLGGVILSAIAGVVAAKSGPPWLACPLAVILAFLAMSALRCLHTPGVAVALAAIVGGEGIRRQGFDFVLRPVMVDWALLLVIAHVMQKAWPTARGVDPVEPARPAKSSGSPQGWRGA